MPSVKRIVCLANSYKPPSGRCIAGKEVHAKRVGAWIRPVSTRSTREVSFSEYRYRDNSTPALLDIVDVPMSHAAPHNHQTEMLDGGCLLCSEEKPHHCHRRLVAEYLKEQWPDVDIEHIPEGRRPTVGDLKSAQVPRTRP